MNAYSPLRDLIDALEQGNQYHISIEFFNKSLQQHLQLPRRHIIHATEFCDTIKQKKGVLERCLRCKGKAIEKARQEKKPFAGLCTFGVYECCYPVFRGDVLLCIIFVGNILNDEAAFLERSGISAADPLLNTMHRNMDLEQCIKISAVVASYILMLYDTMPEAQEKQINGSIAAIKGYIDSYFFQDISLSTLASLYHYNEKYLGILFKKQIGMSFHNYLNERRMRNAVILLQNTSDSILDVAVKSGFNNVTYFNRLFKAKYNATPSQYRKTHTK